MKRVWILSVILILTLLLKGQNDFSSETSIGIKAGTNFSNLIFDPAVPQNSMYGIVAGIGMKHISQKSLGILVEVLYHQDGWDEKFDSIYHYKRNLDYIRIPFMTHIVFGKRNFKFNINLGPHIGFLVKEKITSNLDPILMDSTYYGAGVSGIFDYGLCGGIGFIQKTKIGAFQLEGRYYLSFYNIFKESNQIPYSSTKNQNIEFCLSYFIQTKKLFKK